jgi:hypothetical protein
VERGKRVKNLNKIRRKGGMKGDRNFDVGKGEERNSKKMKIKNTIERMRVKNKEKLLIKEKRNAWKNEKSGRIDKRKEEKVEEDRERKQMFCFTTQRGSARHI